MIDYCNRICYNISNLDFCKNFERLRRKIYLIYLTNPYIRKDKHLYKVAKTNVFKFPSQNLKVLSNLYFNFPPNLLFNFFLQFKKTLAGFQL